MERKTGKTEAEDGEDWKDGGDLEDGKIWKT
jgi:hypothetical protein